ncbi:MAG TPA: RnfABCDGE type electron transport complex subunit B [Firmicutes bacterium]|nr:RnfABCDGE type electron transport complex subunit B [Candidatus Fermentithermobacillaceae bacterium]
MIEAILTLGISGLAFGVLLGVAARKFRVEQDPRISKIIEVLPGANCGGCGFPGCSGLAAAIVGGQAPVNACTVGGNAVAEKVAEIMGVQALAVAAKVAVVYCQGSLDVAEKKAEYVGIEDCRALDQLGGVKGCPYGCLGLGSCVKACKFGAMYMSPQGIPVVIREKCTGCGACVKACPRKIIELVPADKQVHILCRSYDKGPQVRKYCKLGCIACQACVRACPLKAISTDRGTLARIDYSLCDNCEICVSKCPVKTIVSYKVREEKAVS